MELPGRCGDWLDTATVTVQGSRSGSTRRARGGDFYLATSEDLNLATSEDFSMATDRQRRSRASLPVMDPVIASDRWVGTCFRHEPRISSRPRSEGDPLVGKGRSRAVATSVAHAYT